MFIRKQAIKSESYFKDDIFVNIVGFLPRMVSKFTIKQLILGRQKSRFYGDGKIDKRNDFPLGIIAHNRL